MIDLGLTQPALHGEWWRLWTAHLVHWDAQHLLANVVAAIVPFIAATPRLRIRMLVWGVAAAPLLSLFVLRTFDGEMRGASGLVVGFWILAALGLLREGERRLGALLLVAIAAKLAAETTGFIQPHDGYVTLTTLHYFAAMLAAAAVLGEARPARGGLPPGQRMVTRGSGVRLSSPPRADLQVHPPSPSGYAGRRT